MIGFSLFFVILHHNLTEDMKYYEVNFHIQSPESTINDVKDVVSALACEAGFETFEETQDGGLKGYVQQGLFDRGLLDSLLSSCPFEDTTVSYDICEAEDCDWNEQWEQEGFEPIWVEGSNKKLLVIHDGRHLPESTKLGQPLVNIEIDARLAFGTGTHETTRMMCSALMEQSLDGKLVLDCGCGTGILGIVALKLDAAECTAYDIDEWSVDNTHHNAVINRVDERLKVLHGDASLLSQMEKQFDVVMANINRNILLNDMPSFCKVMKPHAMLLLSGFYQEDIPLLLERAQELGLTLTDKKEENGWCALIFKL